MKKAKPKTYYEFLPIYNRSIFYSNDRVDLLRTVLKYFPSGEINTTLLEEVEHALAFVAPIESTVEEGRVSAFVMYVDDEEGPGTVSHEATHMTNFIFDYIGQELDIYNDEAQAYLTGYFTQQFFDHVRGVKAKNGKLKRK